MPVPSIKDVWKEAWESPVKRGQLIIITILIGVFGIGLPYFFNYIEKRNGIVLNDWVLAHIPAHDVSVLIFTVIWGMILLILYRSLYSPSIFITYCLTLALVTVARVICISVVPLAPPIGLIPLSDPVTGIFYGESNITKDLFFSGHMATLSVIYFCLEKKTDKLIGLLAVIVLAFLLALQHIHYTVDILTAPVIVYAVYSITSRYLLFKKVKRQKVNQPEKLAKVYRVNN